MIGRRLPDGRHEGAEPGDFWKEPMGVFDTDGDRGVHWHWHCITPDGVHHTLGQHTIYERGDGTITIVEFVHDVDLNEHIGWELKEGMWKDLGGDREKCVVPDMTPPTSQEARWEQAERKTRLWLPR